ncbi:MAG: protoporphyrinogen oxidase [Acidobacteria bacterium]|nr:protoporphyrinogen oxidase [Acidobacteriota bacterium]MCI0625649.1 protoporphyrinogen oxidase [Acidobacteriota bacterium]MCI0721692.1 protoporphyrinogen oxidase [Acidobacteriota bacterium]
MNTLPQSSALRIAVVGGGISGLAAANRILEERARLNRTVELKLLEASSRLGGVVHTIERDGFVMEGGPDSFISEKPWALSLCRRLGLEPNLISTGESQRRSFIVRQGKLQSVPDGFYLVAPTRIWPMITTPIFSWPGKLRMSADLFLPRRKLQSANEDESLASFVRRRLGREALERMAQPMIGGIYTADPEELSLRATMPRFLEMEQEHRSLILAMWRQRQKMLQSQSSGPRYGLFISLDQGMSRLVQALRKKLPASSIHLSSQVSALRWSPSAGHWILDLRNGAPLQADAVCLALAAFQSANLLEGFDTQLATELRSIRYASTATVNLAYSLEDIPRVLEGFGFVVPAIEKREILACTFSHMKFPGRAPQNHALFRAFMGGSLQPRAFDYDEGEMIRIVRQNLRELLGIEKAPLFALVERHVQAMAQYRVGHLDLVADIEANLKKHSTLQLAGNGFTGIGIPDCIRRGEECAGRLLEALEATSPQGSRRLA